MSAVRVAVVGGGPRAVWALERLAAHRRGAALEIDVLTGGSALGAGSAYATDQPDLLRLNVASAAVDAWLPDARHGPDLDGWREARQPGASADAFPPRALVGRYLADQAARVLDLLQEPEARARVRVLADRATRLRHDDHGWRLEVDDEDLGPYDHVLLATGHERDWGGSLARDWTGATPLHGHVFPLDHLMARPELAAEERPVVVLRGAALTAYDALLALAAAHPGIHVVMASRSGRLMHPKTEPSVLAQRLDAQVLARRADVLLDSHDVLPALAVLAGEVLGRAAGDLPPEPSGDPVAELGHALDVARGSAEPDESWAWAQAWRIAYAAMVRRQRSVAADAAVLGMEGWAALAQRMERLAFGPPPATAEAVLRHLKSGTASVAAVDGDAASLSRLADAEGASLVVDAVLAPPGVRNVDPEGLIGRALAAGHLAASPSSRGCLVDQRCRALTAAGEPVPGLAVVGRACEDVVLGHDTLVRALHPQLDAWAEDVRAHGGAAHASRGQLVTAP